VIDAVGGQNYSYSLTHLEIGNNYSFWLQVVDSDGAKVISGPLSIYYDVYEANTIFIPPWSYYQSSEILSIGLAIIGAILSLYIYVGNMWLRKPFYGVLRIITSVYNSILSKLDSIIRFVLIRKLAIKYYSLKNNFYIYSCDISKNLKRIFPIGSKDLPIFAILSTTIYYVSLYYYNYFVIFIIYICNCFNHFCLLREEII